MGKYDVVIIGGGPAGLTAAISARNTYPDKKIGLVRKEKIALIPCGIPYIFATLDKIEDDILPDTPLEKNNVDLIIDEVVDTEDNTIDLKSGEKITFEKCVLATGSTPSVPPIPGIDKEGVWYVKKDMGYLKRMKDALDNSTNIVIVGGGFIGVELADEIIKKDKEVTIIEMQDSLLPVAMDKEFGDMAVDIMKKRGVEVLCNTRVKGISGGNAVETVMTDDGKELKADAVIVAVGYRPNNELAKKFKIEVDEKYGIKVDEYLRTSKEGIFAVGDCARKRCGFTGDYSGIMLASTAMAHGRLAGSNLYSIHVLKGFHGTIGTFSTKIDDVAFGVAGITEDQAKKIGVNYVVGYNETVDKHPGKLPGANKIYTKLIYSRYSHVLLGAQVKGGDSVGEMINMYSVIIQNRMTDMEIDAMQIGTHPLLTSSPVAYPVINATVDAIMKWYK